MVRRASAPEQAGEARPPRTAQKKARRRTMLRIPGRTMRPGGRPDPSRGGFADPQGEEREEQKARPEIPAGLVALSDRRRSVSSVADANRVVGPGVAIPVTLLLPVA